MKLEDLNKKHPFRIPENYFEELPSRVQSRVSVHRESGVFPLVWKVALPIMVILLAVYLIPTKEVEEPTFESSQIISYLDDSDITSLDIIEEFEVDKEMLATLISEEISFNETSIESELEWTEVETLLWEEE